MTNSNTRMLAVLSGILLFLGSCSRDNGTAVSEEAEILPEDIVELRDDQIKLAGIGFGKVEVRSLSNTIKAYGVVSVAPNCRATICMPMGGFIKSTVLLPGDAVKKGQTLAVIENQEFVDIQLGYLEAKNKLDYARAEYERHTSLYEDDVYSEKNVQQVTVEYKNQLALMRSLEQKLMLIGIDPDQLREDNISSTVSLVSPLTGFLSNVDVKLGMYVSPTDILYEVINSDKLFLELTLFEKDVDKAAIGQRLTFFTNNGSEEHEAVITQIGKSLSHDKTLTLYATVTGSCRNVLPGMYVSAEIRESDTKVPSLPAQSIVSFDDKNYIFIFEKDKEEDGKPFTEYRMVEVKTGSSSSGYTEVILPEGFDTDGTRVVTKGAYNLLSAKKNAGEMAC